MDHEAAAAELKAAFNLEVQWLDAAGSEEGQNQQEEGDASFCVWPENWRAMEIFLACETQWKLLAGLGGGGYLGLDYVALEAVLRMFGVKPQQQRAVFEQVQLMEWSALPILNASDPR